MYISQSIHNYHEFERIDLATRRRGDRHSG